MKKFFVFKILLSLLLLVAMAETAQAQKERRLTRDADFEDMIVRGKYQYPDEAVATVEDEKILNDLLGVRQHFKDRLKQSAERH